MHAAPTRVSARSWWRWARLLALPVLEAQSSAPRLREPNSGAVPRVRVIKPGKGSLRYLAQDLWEFRETIYFLTWRDIKVRYKQTVLGALWAIIQPVMTMVVMSLVLGR